MKIKSVTASRLGPFYEPVTIELDPRVTIITGANDAGKSSALRVVELALTDKVADEAFINHDHILQSQVAWSTDPAVTVEAYVELTERVDLHGGPLPINEGDHSRVRRAVARDVATTKTQTHTRHHGDTEHRVNLPAIIKPSGDLENLIRDEIDLKSPTQLEQALLDAGFKARFDFARLDAMQPVQFSRAIRDAQEVLNRLLERVLPYPGIVKFDLILVEGNRSRLGVLIRDRHDGITPFGNRGAGVRRMITMMAELITYHRSAHHKLILLDEPENSLHADAQHLLREFLFDMTADGKTQVIYATHSPAMINPMRPEQVRLLTRHRIGDIATSKLMTRPTSENFAFVRTTLGISAADSLLYAPVTIITEGETEIRNILPLIQKLAGAEHPKFTETEKLLGLCTFLDGMGDKFSLLCRLARSHGTQVVLFLDGDKRPQVAEQDVEKDNPGMPIIFTPGNSEFEDLVPKSIYIRAALELVGLEFSVEKISEFDAWVASNPRRARMAFSKRVELWFRETFNPPFQAKATVMRKAIELTPVAEITTEPLAQLLDGIRAVLRGSSFD